MSRNASETAPLMQQSASNPAADVEFDISGPVVDLKVVEDIVFEKFYGGPLSGSKTRLAAALQDYLNALLRDHRHAQSA